jgi:hypothetical protein
VPSPPQGGDGARQLQVTLDRVGFADLRLVRISACVAQRAVFPLASRLASRDVQKGLTGKPEFRLNPPFSKVAQRRSNKEIAAELVISERAARSHASTSCSSWIGGRVRSRRCGGERCDLVLDGLERR